jgi:2,4-dienoyl-CoA reductase-like NADH-dependent reductase (Old Yellow Enzyme family)
MQDDDIDRLIDEFVYAAVLAQKAGFHFVDVKHCHGYVGHEFLSAVNRDGKYGGSFENRTRFLRSIVEGIRAQAPGLDIGVRLSAFDWMPFIKGDDGVGIPSLKDSTYPYAFGGATSGLDMDLTETFKFLELLRELGIELVCVTDSTRWTKCSSASRADTSRPRIASASP